MDETIKEILDELILFLEEGKSIKYLKNAETVIGNKYLEMVEYAPINTYLSVAIQVILGWSRDSQKGYAAQGGLELVVNDPITNNIRILFEECPEISEIFYLGDDYLGWAENLNNEVLNEIKKYILDNYKLKIFKGSGRRIKR
ncbi:hypothetical protein [Aureivirga sp. CE67]|uniref:hypothetical protein n=1 Tax=Aureivirga sp. CE67 TaxID=1788983 RepID=UPI0018CB7F38|nr:hypothetical protein [Aureivirga sp. CE67]